MMRSRRLRWLLPHAWYSIPLAMLLLTPPVNAEEVTQTYTIDVWCTSSGQLCDPPYLVEPVTDGVLKAKYIVTGHCSSVRVYFYPDGALAHTSEFLGWSDNPAFGPLDTGLVDRGPVSAGSHRLEVQAEGTISGCNQGLLQVWQGDLEVVTSTSPAECVPPPEGLIGWWPGDGDARDIVGSNDGTLQGSPVFVAGKVGEAFSLNGVTDYIEIGDPTELKPPALQSITMAAWVNCAGPGIGGFPNLQVIVGKAGLTGMPSTDAYYLRHARDAGMGRGQADFAMVDTTGAVSDQVAGPFISDGDWYHIAGGSSGYTLQIG